MDAFSDNSYRLLHEAANYGTAPLRSIDLTEHERECELKEERKRQAEKQDEARRQAHRKPLADELEKHVPIPSYSPPAELAAKAEETAGATVAAIKAVEDLEAEITRHERKATKLERDAASLEASPPGDDPSKALEFVKRIRSLRDEAASARLCVKILRNSSRIPDAAQAAREAIEASDAARSALIEAWTRSHYEPVLAALKESVHDETVRLDVANARLASFETAGCPFASSDAFRQRFRVSEVEKRHAAAQGGGGHAA